MDLPFLLYYVFVNKLSSVLERILFLKKVELFSEINAEDMVEIASIMEEKFYDSEQAIVKEGEVGDSMFIIYSGKVKVEKNGTIVATLGEGECVGEMAILDNSPRSATVKAMEPTMVFQISSDDFFDILQEKPEITKAVFRVLTGRLRRTLEMINNKK